MIEQIDRAVKEGRDHLAENEAKELLRDAGIPTTDFQYFEEIDQIDISKLVFPVALKLCSPEVLHKTDVGGVILGIESRERLAEEIESLQRKFPGKGLLVEPMYYGNVEIIIGLINDATFGLSIMFGIGGVYAEIYRDVTFRVIPINRDDAEEMVSEIRAAPILEGFRKIKVDREGVISLLVAVSDLGMRLRESLDQMDLNPVLVSADDVVVVDAKMILKKKISGR